jgi:hypothetical protein
MDKKKLFPIKQNSKFDNRLDSEDIFSVNLNIKNYEKCKKDPAMVRYYNHGIYSRGIIIH